MTKRCVAEELQKIGQRPWLKLRTTVLDLAEGLERKVNYICCLRSIAYGLDVYKRQIIDNGSEVTLFTRPRRFGKTLNMSMLKAFFEIGADPAWFEELKISKEKDLCDKHLGKYPVIFMSLKEVSGLNYEEACLLYTSRPRLWLSAALWWPLPAFTAWRRSEAAEKFSP